MSVRSQPEAIQPPLVPRMAEAIQINFEYLFSDLKALETSYAADVRGVTLGGTGLALYAVGDLLTASGTTTLARLADVATGSVLVSGGVGAAPAWSATPTVTTLTVTGAFGCNATTAQAAYASGGALAAYGAGANGFDSGANASALHALVVKIRAALVANGIMS